MKINLKAIVLSAVLFSGCSSGANSADTVSASFYPMYLISSFIADGSKIEIKNVASPQTGCLHDYQLTTGNIRQLAQSGVLIINGGDMEQTFLNGAQDLTNIKIIDSSSLFEEEEHEHDHEETEEHEEHEEHESHDHDGHNHEENSHYWMSLDHAELQAEAITDGLEEIYPSEKNIFENNLKDFKSKCDRLKKEYNFYSYPQMNVISFNEAFEYLAEENNINIIKTFEVDENSLPSAKELAEAVDEGREHNISAVICADDSGKTYAQTIADELHIPVVVLNPITYVDGNTKSYFSAMKNNFDLLKEVFENDKP